MNYENIAQYQQHIDAHIRKLGGYWISLSALARLHEEVGELGELLLQEPLDMDEIGAEIADIYVISTCIANQYLNRLAEEYAAMGYPTETHALQNLQQSLPTKDRFMLITNQSGKIARIINHYDGDKVKKQSEKPMRLGPEISHLHLQLLFFANALELNVFHHIDRVLALSSTRDKGRFAITHDPTTEPSLDHFRKAFEHRYADFFATAKIWGSYEWQTDTLFMDNLRHSLPSFTRFAKCAEPEGLDGYVFSLPAYTNHDLFEQIITYFTKQPAKKASKRKWHLSFHGAELIATAFSKKEHAHHENAHFLYIRPASTHRPPWE